MPEAMGQVNQASPGGWKALLPICPVFVLLVAAILIWGAERAPEEQMETEEPISEAGEAAPLLLVTAEHLARMSYTDSVLGPIQWEVSTESLEELNRVLREYGISSAEEVSQFLAQAAVETAGGKWLTELGTEDYFQSYGYTTGTRGAGYLHLTFEYGQMAFSTWTMKKYIPELADITYRNPRCHSYEEIREAYYAALRSAANLGLDVSRYSRIVYDPQCPAATGADYIAEAFAWESAAYYWKSAGISEALSSQPGEANTDIVSKLVGGGNWQSRREAYQAFYPVLISLTE